MQKQKILVYGITGLLGSRIKLLLQDKFKIIAPPHSHLNLLDKKRLRENIEDVMPDQIIYAAGLTKVDYCEEHEKEAFALNHEAIKTITKKASQLQIPVHYISTDAVFDGTNKKRPYKENDKTNPLSIYGKSKLKGELQTLAASPKNSVVRTIMLYSSFFPHKKDFARLAYESLKNNEKFVAIEDQVINPTFVDDLVWALAKIVERRANGIYHVAATDYTTNLGFVQKIAKIFHLNEKLILKEKFSNFFRGKPAPRGQFSWLSTAKFEKDFSSGILHSLDESLLIFKKQIEKSKTLPIDI